jgi:transcriptional regulator with XRE-family HTH domain
MAHDRHAYGPLVRALREAKGLTLESLSGATGLSLGYLSRVERGERTATWDSTVKIAAALGVDPKYLTGQLPALRPLRLALLPGRPLVEFAESVGLDEYELTRIECGSVSPTPELLDRIAQRLGVPAHVLSPSP